MRCDVSAERERDRLNEEIQRQDDQVAAAVNHLKSVKIDRQFVPALDDKSFYAETASRDILVVLFYLTCKACGFKLRRFQNDMEHI